jgi:hypothetical protein
MSTQNFYVRNNDEGQWEKLGVSCGLHGSNWDIHGYYYGHNAI